MKKYIALMTVLLMLLCAGCGTAGNDDNNVGSNSGHSDALDTPQLDSREGTILYIGLEGFARMTRDELIIMLGEPDEESTYGHWHTMRYFFPDSTSSPDNPQENYITIEYFLPSDKNTPYDQFLSKFYGGHPMSVSARNDSVFALRHPVLPESNQGMTEREYVAQLSDLGIVYSKGSPLPGDTELSTFDSSVSMYFLYTSDFRYLVGVRTMDDHCSISLYSVTSLEYNTFWNGNALCFGSQDTDSVELTELLGTTIDHVFYEIPALTCQQVRGSIDSLFVDSGEFNLHLTLHNDLVSSIDITAYDSLDTLDMTLYGLPLSVSRDEMAEHMRTLGYAVSDNNQQFSLEYITAEIDASSGQIYGIRLEDHSYDASYEPVADSATRDKATLEEYFSQNLAVYGNGSIYADLNHDGVDELLVTSAGEYDANVLTIYTVQDGEVVELYRMEHSDAYMAGYGTKYLYSEDGVDYLLDIPVQISYTVPNCYTIFFFDENGQQVVFREESTSDGADSAVVDANKAKYLEQATLLISHDDRYQSNIEGTPELKAIDLMDVICYPERVAKEVLGDHYDTTVKVWINRPDPYNDGGSGLPDDMLNKVSCLQTSSPNVTICGARVGMTEAEFLAALEPHCDPKFMQSSPTLCMDGTVLEGTYYAAIVFYTLKDGVVSEILIQVELGTPA